MVNGISRTAILLLFLLLLPFSLLPARDIPLPEEEDATSLFDAELEDAEVDFFIQGNWAADIGGGFGFTWGTAVQGVQPAVLPDFTDGYLFNQTPELTLSLWYKNRYFFETTITQEQTLETFLFGYYGNEGEFLQEARIGNTDIGFGEAGPFSIPAASRDSLGAYSLMTTDSTSHQLALRYDPARLEEVHYRGKNLIETSRAGLREYIRGRFFIFPDEDVEDLEVYLQDDEGIYTDGSGRRYRRLDDDDMTSSQSGGVLYLNEQASGDLLVHYTRGGLPVGDASLGTDALCGVISDRLDLDAPAVDFSFGAAPYLGITPADLERSIDGKTGLLLYSPGQWSPFELLGSYTSGFGGTLDPVRLDIRLVDKNTSTGLNLPFTAFQDPDLLRISPESTAVRDHAARYPLLAFSEDYPEVSEIYGPRASQSTDPLEKELLAEQLSPVSSFNIGTNALEGSIVILRNDLPATNFSFNPETGEINFFTPPSAGERIDITFRSQTSKAVGGDLFAVTANKFSFGEYWSADLNVGLRWNADSNAYISEEGEAEGAVLTSGRVQYSTDQFSFSLEGGVNVSNPNTTGRLRLFGMDDSAFPLSPDIENLYPGAPVTASQYTATGGIGPFPHSSRGVLFYKDYYDYSFAEGYNLQDYRWDPPDDQVYSYNENGGDNRTGPYLAATGDETEGNAMVLDYVLTSGQWVAGIIPIAAGGGPVDLSHARALTMLVKSLGPDGTVPNGDIDIHFLLGRLSEDLDNDGLLDEENSPYDQGFSFNLPNGETAAVAPALTWSPSESLVNSEDLDGNGVLEGSSSVSEALDEPFIDDTPRTAGENSPTLEPGSWYRITIPLDSDDREKLQAANAFEVVLAENSGASASGRLLIADIDLQGTPFTGSTAGSTALDIYTRSLDPGSSSYRDLLSSGDAVLLNGESVFNTKVLRISWEDTGGSDTFSAAGFSVPVDLGNYESLSFYMKTGSDPPDPLTIIIKNPDDEGMALQFSPPADTGWSKYTWHLDATKDTERISRGGSSIAGGGEDVSNSTSGLAKRKRSAANVNTMIISGTITNADQIELDEIYFHDPVLGIGAGGNTRIEYHRSGEILRFRDAPLISDLDFYQTVYGKQDEYGGGFTEAPAGNLSFSNLLGITIINARLSLDYSGQWDGIDYLPGGGYSITVPFFKNKLLFKDGYHENHRQEAIDITREASLRMETARDSTFVFSHLLDWDGTELLRSWDSRLRFGDSDGLSMGLSDEFVSETAEVNMEAGDLQERYGRSLSLIYPEYTEGPLYRTTGHSLDLQWNTERFSATITPSVSSTTFPGEVPFSLNSGSQLEMNLTCEIPSPAASPGSLLLTYSRSGFLRRDYSTGTDFLSDITEIFGRMPDYPLVWTSAPIHELWSSTTRELFSSYSSDSTSATYGSRGTFTFDRPPGSCWSSLIAPSQFTLSASRILSRQLDGLTDTLNLESAYTATALNLFGSLGRYPAFFWYRTEEISHSAGYSGYFPLAGSSDQRHEIGVSQLLRLNVNENNTVGMENSWSGDISEERDEVLHDIGSLLFWERKREVFWDFPFREQLKEGTQFLIHREHLEFSFTDQNEYTFQYTLLGGHTSEFQLPESGFAKIFGRFGFEQQTVSGSSGRIFQYILAMEIGMEVELRF